MHTCILVVLYLGRWWGDRECPWSQGRWDEREIGECLCWDRGVVLHGWCDCSVLAHVCVPEGTNNTMTEKERK